VRLDEFGKLFDTFKRAAFRLETLSFYSVDEDDEAEAFRLFCSGQPQAPKDREWPKLVAAACAAGKTMQRVRIVRPPVTDYLRFELSWGYPDNIAAGEVIRILPVVGELPAGIMDYDYWLFDDGIAVAMDYDEHGRFIGPRLVPDPAPYCRCRDRAMAAAVPFAEYRVAVDLRT
jgi:hypothetical protein